LPIAFRDVEEIIDLGSAAFLKVERYGDGGCCLGGLLVITARGAPLEFGYNRVRVPQPFLWREADLRRYSEHRLTTSLLSVCSQQPRLLVCLANEVGASLFGEDLRLEVPVVRVGEPIQAHRRIDTETGEVLEEDDVPSHIAWQPGPPDDGSPERQLFEHLAAHGLLLEPFERAAIGLYEVFGASPCQSAH
jgi:hypothetical protein